MNMKKSQIAQALIAGAALAAAGTTYAAANAQLTIADDASEEVSTTLTDWIASGTAASGRKDKCYGIALAGENDCKAGAGDFL